MRSSSRWSVHNRFRSDANQHRGGARGCHERRRGAGGDWPRPARRRSQFAAPAGGWRQAGWRWRRRGRYAAPFGFGPRSPMTPPSPAEFQNLHAKHCAYGAVVSSQFPAMDIGRQSFSLRISDAVIHHRQNLLGTFDQIGVWVLLAIKAEPSAIRVGEFIGDDAALARVIPPQPSNECSHVRLSGCEELAAGDLAVVQFLTVSARDESNKHCEGIGGAAPHNSPSWIGGRFGRPKARFRTEPLPDHTVS